MVLLPRRGLDEKTARYGLVGTLALLAIFATIGLWLQSPPGAARLLPECDGLVYLNVAPLRWLTHFDRTPVARAPEFQQFIDATGIVPERDLDAVALALHRMDDPRGPNGAVAFSEVFQGRFDTDRLARYLARISIAHESYAGKTIFTIPVGEIAGPGGRRLRVAVVENGRVAASNAPTTEQIHAMLDRERGGAGPSLLTARYGAVPWFASAWGIGRLGLPFAENGFVSAAGLRLPIPDNAGFVASLRYFGSIKLRVEELTPTALDAARTAEKLNSLLTLLRTFAENQPGGLPGAAREAADSFALRAVGNNVVLTGTVPGDLLRQLTGAPPQAPR